MLRAHLKSELMKRIDDSRYFEPEDFEWEEAESKLHFSLVYRHEPRFRFSVSEEHSGSLAALVRAESRETQVVVTVSPGELRAVEKFTIPNASSVISQVGAWITRIHEELIATPIVRALEEQRSKVEELLAETAKIPNDYFTKEEAEELKKKLSDLEKDLQDRVVSDTSENAEVKGRIEELTTLVAELRAQVDSLTKRGWFGSAIIKFTRWASTPENSALLKGGVNVVKALMPGSENTK
jgi:hypothetical protein